MVNLVQFPRLGIELNIKNVAFSIGSIDIYWYGILIGIGMLLALAFAFKNARSFGIDDDRMIDVIFLTAICAVICARAYYVAFAPFKYDSLWDMINIRDGGIAIYGAIIGAAVFGCLFCKLRKVPVLPMFDLTALGFLIGQCVGRWGNFFNQEAFGTNTQSLFGMYSPATNAYLTAVTDTLALEGVIVNPTLAVHPTFLYESIWCLIGFILLALHIKHRRFDGEIAIFYAVWYGIGRFFIEAVRTDSLMTGFLNLRTSQLVAAFSVIAGIIAWIILNKKKIGVTPPLEALKKQAAINEQLDNEVIEEQAQIIQESKKDEALSESHIEELKQSEVENGTDN